MCVMICVIPQRNSEMVSFKNTNILPQPGAPLKSLQSTREFIWSRWIHTYTHRCRPMVFVPHNRPRFPQGSATQFLHHPFPSQLTGSIIILLLTQSANFKFWMLGGFGCYPAIGAPASRSRNIRCSGRAGNTRRPRTGCR